MAQSFSDFMQARLAASNAYIAGDPAPLQAILTDTDPASFMPPSGAVISGAAASASVQAQGAAAFGPGSTGRFEIIDSGSDGDLGFWTGTQPAEMEIKGQPGTTAMTLRVTEIFRREGGEWKLAHRHADMMKA